MIYNRKGLYDELAMIAEMDQAETGLQVNTCNKHVDMFTKVILLPQA
jgi:hypothetical protein